MRSILFLQQHVFLECRFEVSPFTSKVSTHRSLDQGHALAASHVNLCLPFHAQYFIPSGDSEVQRKPLLERQVHQEQRNSLSMPCLKSQRTDYVSIWATNIDDVGLS
jgi:hypothetical protein